jgi:hypothetical protein
MARDDDTGRRRVLRRLRRVSRKNLILTSVSLTLAAAVICWRRAARG